MRDFQLVEQFFCLALRLPAAEFGKLRFQLRRLYAVFVGKIALHIERVFFVHDIDKAFMPKHDGTNHRFVIVRVLILHENGHSFVFTEDYFPFIRFKLAGKHP